VDGCRAAKALDLVLYLQFTTLDFDDCDVIRGRMVERFVKLIFEGFVLSFQFRKMSQDRHWHLHLISLGGGLYITPAGCRWLLRIGFEFACQRYSTAPPLATIAGTADNS
jgi:hypothetical protein